MKKEKTKENFQEDILKVTGEQDKKIESLVDLVTQSTKTIEDLASIIKNRQNDIAQKQEIGNVVFTDITFARLISQEDTQKRANEVAKLVKPILEKYGVAKLNAFLVQPK